MLADMTSLRQQQQCHSAKLSTGMTSSDMMTVLMPARHQGWLINQRERPYRFQIWAKNATDLCTSCVTKNSNQSLIKPAASEQGKSWFHF